ncbi:hypothetical protein ACE1BH_08150 [Aeromonas jandaei]
MRSEHRALPPLEYFKIDRAAKILGCEIEDIFHWSMTGAIDLHLLFTDERKCYELEFADTGNLTFSVQEGSEYREGVSNILEEWHARNSLNRLIVIDGMVCGDYNRPWMEKSIVKIYIKPSYDGSTPYNKDYHSDRSHREAIPIGYFFTRVDSKMADSVINGLRVDEVKLAAYRSDGDYSGVALFTISMNSSDFINALRIEHEDVKKLQKHIFSGKLFDGDDAKVTPIKNNFDINPGTHEKKREEVYAAALYALFNWPEEFGVPSEYLNGIAANKFADVVINHSAFIFGKDDAPLGRDKISKLLSTAMKTGKVHKSK